MADNIFAIVLAAGRAERFGSTKQLVEIGGQTMVRRAVTTAAETCGPRTLLVTGHDRGAVADACLGLPGFVAVNDAYEHGIGSSIACAVAATAHVAAAIVVLLADQPLVTAGHLRTVIGHWSGDADEIVTSSFAGTTGPPTLFPASCFGELAALDGDRGGRHLLRDPRYRVVTVDCDAAASDVDTPDDLRRISRSARS